MGLLRLRGIGALPWILCLLACSPAGAQRLPTTVTPDHYDLAFDVDLAAARFEGVETIKVSLAEPSRRITLNALDLQVHEVTTQLGRPADDGGLVQDYLNQGDGPRRTRDCRRSR